MFTLFALPKPFIGHFDIIQRNAIKSWINLHPSCEILLFGNDKGTAEVASEYGLRHIPEIAQNSSGTPLLNDAFAKAQQLAKYPTLCYVNADIILMQDCTHAIVQVTQQFDRFLLVGQRWDIDLKETINFSSISEEDFRAQIRQSSTLHDVYAIDYFVFSRGGLGTLPPFAVGRAGWDNWMIYRARYQGIPVIDATPSVVIAHQNHDYSHLEGGQTAAYQGIEALQNRMLAGEESYFNIRDATHRLTALGPEFNLEKACLWQRLNRQTSLSRFKGKTLVQHALFKVLVWAWIILFVSMPFLAFRKLVYSWLSWSEEKSPQRVA